MLSALCYSSTEANPFQGVVKNGPDQLGITPIHPLGHDREVSVKGGKARKGIHLQKIGFSVLSDPNIDA